MSLGVVAPSASGRSAIRVRAPLRLGLAGGGTDLSPYCDEYGGAILNCTIDRYAYAFIEPRADGQIHFRARDVELEESFNPADIDAAQLALHRGVYRRLTSMAGQPDLGGITVTTMVDAPAGSGLGSSSALVVALVEAFRVYLGLPLGLYDVAHLAWEIERIDLGLSGGKQDQYAAAFGGINYIEFLANDRVVVNPLRVPPAIAQELETSLVICFSGQSRESAAIIDQQIAGMTQHTSRTIEALHRLKHDAAEMKLALLRGEIREVAAILDKSWASKKSTAANVSNDHLDHLYAVARAHSALAGKVSGAGGGGFMMLMVPPEDRLDLIRALNAEGASASPVKLTEAGCQAWVVPGR